MKHKFKFRLQDFKAQVINHYYTFFTQNLREPQIHVLLLSNNSQTPTPLLCMSQCIFHFLSETAWDLLYRKSSFGVSQKKKKKEYGHFNYLFLLFPMLCPNILFHFFMHAAAATAKLLQSCPTLCDTIDSSPSGAPVPGILQARTLEWVAMSFSNAWKWKVKVKSLSHVRLLATPWTAAYQVLPSMGFSRQEYWGGLPFPPPFFMHTCRLFLIKQTK